MRINRWATIVLVALATACGGSDGTEAGGGQSADTTATTASGTTATTASGTTATTASGTTSPSVAPSGPNLWFDGIWPDSRAALDDARVAVDQGHQPWRADPVATARAYLVDLGIAEPAMGAYQPAGGRTGVVRYESGSGPGFVFLRRVEGNPLPYVVRVETTRFDVVQTEREGGVVRVEIGGAIPGTVVARAGSFGSEWQDEREAPLVPGPPVTLTLAIDDPRHPVLLEVRHQGDDGVASVARVRVQPAAPSGPSGGARLSTDSRLRVGGFGPVEVGMTIDQALAAAGVPMTISGSPYCEILTAPGGPELVRFVSTAESEGRITVIGVVSESVSTEEGIGYGSTEAEVMAAYPAGELTRWGSDDAHRLVHRPADAGDQALAFLIVNSKVVQMETGLAGLMEAQEYCS